MTFANDPMQRLQQSYPCNVNFILYNYCCTDWKPHTAPVDVTQIRLTCLTGFWQKVPTSVHGTVTMGIISIVSVHKTVKSGYNFSETKIVYGQTRSSRLILSMLAAVCFGLSDTERWMLFAAGGSS